MNLQPVANRFLAIATLVLLAILRVDGIADESTDELGLSQFYGFTGVEVYKLDGRAFSLCHGDFDSDGRTDIVTVDNRASCLRYFRQKAVASNEPQANGKYVNKLNSDWRFDIRQISVDKQVSGLISGDFNSDGRIDLAYIGLPDRLIVRFQPEKGKQEWTERWSVRLPDLAQVVWMIAAGDLNSDGRQDIAVLGKTATYVVYQSDGKEKSGAPMGAAEPLINTSSQLALLQIADLNGDGRDDLSYQANNGSSRGLCARLQTTDGRLGPEVRFDLHQPRSVTLHDVDQKPGKEILTIDSRTGRVVVSAVRKLSENSGELPSRLVQYGVGDGTSREQRAIAIGDIDGDQKSDVIVTDPANAQVLVYRQKNGDGLGTAEAYPGLLGAIDVCIADVDGNGSSEVILMSDKESAVAVSQFHDGRLQFPRIVARPLDGFDFSAMAFVKGKEKNVLAVCQKKGSGSSAVVKLQQLTVSKDGTWSESTDSHSLEASALGTRGLALLPMDADHDGAQDLLVVPNGANNKGVVLLPTALEGGVNSRWTVESLNVGASSAGELFEKDGLLYVAREAFARVMKFADNEWAIADQFNAGESRARIDGVAVLDLDGDDTDEVVLVDTGVKKLRALRKTNGLYRPWREVDLGTIKFESTHVADLNGDNHDDLLLFGNQQFSVLYSGNVGSELVELTTFESDREDAFPADIIAGDVNGDGRVDLTLIDTSIDGLELLNYDATKGLQSATHFRVFEEKRLVSKSNARGTEPREGLIVDVTGDGRNDIVLLCHDRLLVYPQDAGEPAE